MSPLGILEAKLEWQEKIDQSLRSCLLTRSNKENVLDYKEDEPWETVDAVRDLIARSL